MALPGDTDRGRSGRSHPGPHLANIGRRRRPQPRTRSGLGGAYLARWLCAAWNDAWTPTTGHLAIQTPTTGCPSRCPGRTQTCWPHRRRRPTPVLVPFAPFAPIGRGCQAARQAHVSVAAAAAAAVAVVAAVVCCMARLGKTEGARTRAGVHVHARRHFVSTARVAYPATPPSVRTMSSTAATVRCTSPPARANVIRMVSNAACTPPGSKNNSLERMNFNTYRGPRTTVFQVFQSVHQSTQTKQLARRLGRALCKGCRFKGRACKPQAGSGTGQERTPASNTQPRTAGQAHWPEGRASR